jgi:Tol biopolymer transport system component
MNISPEKLRRIGIIIGFALIIIILGWLIYIIFFKSTPTVEVPDITPTSTTGILPGPGPGVITPIIDAGAPERFPSAIARGGLTETTTLVNSITRGATLGEDGRVNYYDDIEDKFFTIAPDGTITTLSSETFPQVQVVTWAPSATNAILEFPDGANIYYDFNTGEQVTLPQHWSSFNFSPDGDQIVFKSLSLEPENNVLAIADPDGNGSRVIASIGENAYRVLPDWSPNRQMVASYAEPYDGDRQELFFIGLNDENFRKILINGYGYQSLWNPNGTQLLYNVSASSSGNSPTLWLVNAQGEAVGSGRKPLNIKTTVDKCTFASLTDIYCAVPQFLPDGSGLLPSIADGIPDEIYKINAITGASEKVAELDSLSIVSTISISPDGKYLYFTDSFTGKLKSIRLK